MSKALMERLPDCTHGRYEAKSVFVGTGKCALCLTDRIEELEAEVERLKNNDYRQLSLRLSAENAKLRAELAALKDK